MHGPPSMDGRRVEMRLRDSVALVPLVLVMAFIAFWPASLVGATKASLERALAPAQVAAGRPASQIGGVVQPNPPAENRPLPGDEGQAAAP